MVPFIFTQQPLTHTHTKANTDIKDTHKTNKKKTHKHKKTTKQQQQKTNQVIIDFSWGSSVESEYVSCPAGMFDRFEFFIMASKLAAAVTRKTKTRVRSQV